MSNVVPLASRKPNWLYLVAGRLMVRADRPLADLHRMAKLIGCRTVDYRPGRIVPCYLLHGKLILRAVRTFGPMPCQESLLEAALQLCDRRARSGKPIQAK